jgi:hypothetical protein
MKARKTILMTILAMTFILSSQLVKAQFPKDEETGKVKFTGVVDLPGMTKDKICKKAKSWLVSNLKSDDNMVDLSGNNPDQIVGAGNVYLDSIALNKRGDFAKAGSLNFKFIISFKDNKLKYSIENFFLRYSFNVQITGLGEKEYVVQTGLEDMKTAFDYYLPNKDLLYYKEYNTVYIKTILDKLITDFISSMKKSESNDW